MTTEMRHYLSQWETEFLKHRAYLISFAFRMTGSLSEAEDIVQDVFMACDQVDPSQILQPKSWLTKACANRGIDSLKVAYKKRETYPGTWLPDAVPDSFQIWDHLKGGRPVDETHILSESLTTSFLLLIERLTPEERAVYLLSEVFEYPYKEIAEFVNKSEEACRKLAQRAREAVQSGRPKFKVESDQAPQLIADFFAHAKSGNHAGLLSLLADGSEFWADGGGKVSASRVVLSDPNKITAFFVGLGGNRVWSSGNFQMEYAEINQRPGYIISRRLESGEWTFETLMSFEFKDGKIARIYAQRNPDKLEALVNHLRS